MKVLIRTTYTTSVATEVEIPEGKTIDSVFCKWGQLSIDLVDAEGNKSEMYAEEADASLDDTDWKYPSGIVACNEEGEEIGEWA
jgi:hypothetical protein